MNAGIRRRLRTRLVPVDPDREHPTLNQSAEDLSRQIKLESAGASFLVFRDRSGAQEVVDLTGMTQLTVGRLADNGISLGDDQVSRIHAELERVGESWMVADHGVSTNGTFVNGRRVSGKALLGDRDLITVGRTDILFRAPAPRGEVDPTEASNDTAVAQSLTSLQRQILVELCRPFGDGDSSAVPSTNPEIATRLHLSLDAVKGHLRVLFERYGLADLPQNQKRRRLADKAMRSGAVRPRDLAP